MRILITGGAGFVGSRLAFEYRNALTDSQIVVLDNLKRRGSELNLSEFEKKGIRFIHGDIRTRTDLSSLEGNFDLMLECSAEPSVLSGISGGTDYLLQTNLVGTLNCLEFAKERCGGIIFLSTSRVYSIQPLRELPLIEGKNRLSLAAFPLPPGVTPKGITEAFPTHLPRSLYGATKLASEQLIQEYAYAYGVKAIINRCGVLAGAGQLGKVDQGFFTLWIARHWYGGSLSYQGFGGEGKQVRDVLHPADLFSLIRKQQEALSTQCPIFNVGGGLDNSISLKELTAICQNQMGKTIPIPAKPQTHSVDIPYYVSDNSPVEKAFDWKPTRTLTAIAEDIISWISSNHRELELILSR